MAGARVALAIGFHCQFAHVQVSVKHLRTCRRTEIELVPVSIICGVRAYISAVPSLLSFIPTAVNHVATRANLSEKEPTGSPVANAVMGTQEDRGSAAFQAGEHMMAPELPPIW